jgi:predicted transcriptional regulator YheO
VQQTRPNDTSRTAVDTELTTSASKSDILKILKLVGRMISESLGDWCEVVIHDLAELEHSVVWIHGNVTGRSAGSPMTDLGLKKLQANDIRPLIAYAGQTNDGQNLKSSSIFICDQDGEPILAFCVNLDVTLPLLFDHFLHSFLSRSEDSATSERFSQDLQQTLQDMIQESALEISVPIPLMGKPDRIRLLKLLADRGAFQVKKSIPIVASELGVSRRTIYNYLDEIE